MNPSHKSSWEISLGLMPIPKHILHRKPDLVINKLNTKDHRDPASYKKSVRGKYAFNDVDKAKLIEHMKSALDAGILNGRQIWMHIQSLEIKTGNEILLRNNGTLISQSRFDDYLREIKRERNIVTDYRSEKKIKIIDMFTAGFSEPEILKNVVCKKEHIHRILISAGLKKKRPTPNRIYRHNKRK